MPGHIRHDTAYRKHISKNSWGDPTQNASIRFHLYKSFYKLQLPMGQFFNCKVIHQLLAVQGQSRKERQNGSPVTTMVVN